VSRYLENEFTKTVASCGGCSAFVTKSKQLCAGDVCYRAYRQAGARYYQWPLHQAGVIYSCEEKFKLYWFSCCNGLCCLIIVTTTKRLGYYSGFCDWVLGRNNVSLRACASCHNTFVLHLALARVGLSVLLWMLLLQVLRVS